MKLFALYEVKVFHPVYEMYPEITTRIFSTPEARQVRMDAWKEENEYSKSVSYKPVIGDVLVAQHSTHEDDYQIEIADLELDPIINPPH